MKKHLASAGGRKASNTLVVLSRKRKFETNQISAKFTSDQDYCLEYYLYISDF